jgi:rhamnose transport system permease protein
VRLKRYRQELAAATAYVALLALVAVAAPSFFSAANLRDLAINNTPLLITAIGMTMVILAGEIDISVGSQFAVCSVTSGWLAKAHLPIWLVLLGVISVGAAMGALNGLLVGWLRLPSIIVTLAALVVWRDCLRWITQGAWVQDLPDDFQWFGLGQHLAQWVIASVALVVLVISSWALRNLRVVAPSMQSVLIRRRRGL